MSQTTKRYTVSRGVDGMGNRYATGPLTFLETNELAAAQHEVHARGGEVIDHQTRKAWSPGMGWYDVTDYLESVGG